MNERFIHAPPPINDSPPSSKVLECDRDVRAMPYPELLENHAAARESHNRANARIYGAEIDRRAGRAFRMTFGDKLPGRIERVDPTLRIVSPLEPGDITHKKDNELRLDYLRRCAEGDWQAVGVILDVARLRGLPWADGNAGRGGAG